jgi:hypothetical protein
MNAKKVLLILFFMASSSQVFALFGQGEDVGGVGNSACKPPKFTKFTPAHLAVVAPQSEISFLASESTNPKTIAVTAKKKPVEVVSKEVLGGFLISGKLPSSLSDMYARIEIRGATTSGCAGNGGWLLKIDKPVSEEGASADTE